jgi:hypothetical protein
MMSFVDGHAAFLNRGVLRTPSHTATGALMAGWLW